MLVIDVQYGDGKAALELVQALWFREPLAPTQPLVVLLVDSADPITEMPPKPSLVVLPKPVDAHHVAAEVRRLLQGSPS